MTGEALMTQQLATLEVLFQVPDAHLDGRDLMRVQQVEEFTPVHAQQFRRLTLRQFALLKPA